MTDEDTSSGEIATLRRQLRIDESSLVDKYASRIDGIERARPWFIGGAVLGAALTGLGRLDAGTLGIVITAIGIVVATIFGALVGWVDFRKLEISREARGAMAIADQALEKAADYATLLDEQIRHRRARGDRLEAGSLMREAIAAGISADLDAGNALDAMLDAAKLRLIAAFGFDAAEYWAVTIFSIDDSGECMSKTAALWNDSTTSALASRDWSKGEGFTGVAWRNESPVIVADMTRPGMTEAYPVPQGKFRDHDRLRYRSAASYPVIVGGAVWGVVTATSDRAGRFDLDSADGTEAARTVQDLAGYTGMLATIEDKALAL